MGLGLRFWRLPSHEQTSITRFFVAFAFPWFCGLYLSIALCLFGLHNFMPWHDVAIFAFGVICACILAWTEGNRLDRKARNPLYGVLDKK